MQVNKKHLIVILGLLCILLLTYGCVSPSKSSISGKIFIYAGGSQTSSISNVSIKTFYDNKKSSEPVPEFAPDEIIVKYKQGVDPDYMAISTAGSGYSVAKGFNNTGRGAVRVLKLDQAEKALHLTSSIRDRTLKEIERLNSLPSVEYAEPNYIFRVQQFIPDDLEYTKQWHYPLIKIDKVWSDPSLSDLNIIWPGFPDGSSDVTVAVIDTGIVRYPPGTEHPDLSGIFRDEYDFISSSINWLDGTGIDSDASDPIDIGSSFHGTHVAGTIGALTNNGEWVAGVAGGNNSGVQIMPLQVLGQDGIGYTDDIVQAILYAAGLETIYYPTLPTVSKADVINMSFVSSANSLTIKNAINDAYNAGVTLVAAAGNYHTDTPFYPAAYTNVISVAAVGAGAERAYYSNYGDTIDIAAPGGDMRYDLDFDENEDGVYSTLFDDLIDLFITDYYHGTSMAAPHVAGAAAVIIKGLIENPESPAITPSTVKYILTSTAIDLENPEFYGAGLVNAHAAASKAFGQAQPQIPVLYPFPKTLRLDGSNYSGSFILKNIGNSDSININSITIIDENPPGLIADISPDPGSVESGGLEVQVTLDINGLQNGATYHGLIEITYQTDKKENVYVIYKYIGDIYVVALDPETNEIIEMAVTDFEKDYEYVIENLVPGRYIIGASTNRDNDNYLFDAGEAFGFFPDISSEAVLDLKPGTNLLGVDFRVVDELL